MVSKLPEKSVEKGAGKPVIDFDKIQVGKKYRMNRRNPETGEIEEIVVEITSKRENKTTDGSPGAKIFSCQYER